ncbi:MAG: hypothetical protein A2452_10500 [Candidatus Firestonebacteria bacterium RIFOXYC2_FULL_39_67]|nr:MAG: hypothetical protein A2452_10500 [Candidatus Firestonebacteria bacterium RIFOXYC2_FULL_39_67]
MDDLNAEATKQLLDMATYIERMSEEIKNIKDDFDENTCISEYLPTEQFAKKYDSERKTVLGSFEKLTKQIEGFRAKSQELAKKFII